MLGTTANSIGKIADSTRTRLLGMTFTVAANNFYSNLTLGTFRDQDATNTDGRVYSGTIQWGDGSTSAARFTFNGATPDAGKFWLVKGDHLYAKKKTYTVTIALDDTASPAVKYTITGHITAE